MESDNAYQPLISLMPGEVLSTANRPLRLRLAHPNGWPDGLLLPQRIEGEEALCDGLTYRVLCVSPDACIPLKELIALPAELQVVTDRGDLRSLCGIVTEAAAGESDGGLATYQLVIRDALALLDKRINSRIFRQQHELDIVRLLFAEWLQRCPPLAAAFGLEVDAALSLQAFPKREFTMQCNESDAAFIRRLLRRRGINWFFRAEPADCADGAAEGGATPRHTLVLFCDGKRLKRNAAVSLRFHRAGATEERDAITAWSAVRTLQAGSVMRHSWDYRHPRGSQFMFTASTGTAEQGARGGQLAASLDDYLIEPPHVGADNEDHRVLGGLRMGRHDYDTKCFHGEASARDLCAGEWFDVEGHPELDQHAPAEREFIVVAQKFVTWNNLPKALNDRVDRLFARSRWHAIGMQEATGAHAVGAQALKEGVRYHTRFTAVRRGVAIVPAFDPRTDVPQAPMQSALVVGPRGETVHCDGLGRVKIRFPGMRAQDHAQASGAGASGTAADSAWVRVATPWSSDGTAMGQLTLPRVGAEVLVAFMGGDPDKPVIVGQLFNGQGKQPLLSSGGGLPGNRHLSGLQSAEIGGSRGNQLRFDDSRGEIGARLASDHAGSALNLGWLGTPRTSGASERRGEGAELRSDAQIALRAGKGLLLSAWRAPEEGKQLERGAHLALMEEGGDLFQRLGSYAVQHQGLAFDGEAQQALCSCIGQWDAGGASKGSGGAPIAVSAPAGISYATPAAIVSYGGANVDTVAGRSLQLAAGSAVNVQAGRGISLFAQDGGLRAIAHHGKLLLQSQHGEMDVNASGALTLTSSEGKLTASADEILLVSKGGSFIRLADDITFGSNGHIHFKAVDYKYGKPAAMAATLPAFADAAAVPEQDCTLASTFALDQLTNFAKGATQGEFIVMMAPIFGYDIPAPVYVRLYERLRAGEVANAKIVVITGGPYPGAFDNSKREIRVHRSAVRHAVDDKETAWELLAVLLHEFGHYIDIVLREDLADKHPDGTALLDGDAEGEEGAKFAYALALFDVENSKQAEFAQVTSAEYCGSLIVDYEEASAAVLQSQEGEAQEGGDPDGDIELFAAHAEHAEEKPNMSFGHEEIEAGLVAADRKVFDKTTRKQIYFGNWLRDHSQLLSTNTVCRPEDSKDLMRRLSRKSLTKLIEIFAFAKFVEEPWEKSIYRVTQTRLGVYRAVEHIDNPTNHNPDAEDPRAVDPDFEPLPSQEYLDVHPVASMKRYIFASKSFMRAEINQAMQCGKTPNGCRHFGAALHVLEDFFAHSNFVELSLRNLGYPNVLPWTSPVQCKHRYPLVTGMFSSEDIIASTAGMLADVLLKPDLKFKAKEPGKRTTAEKVLLVLLEEHSFAPLYKGYKRHLGRKDQINRQPEEREKQEMEFYQHTGAHLSKFVFNALLHLLGNSVDDMQVYTKGDPNTNGSTDPSHSQLAKDHDDHHFHSLAAELAIDAVRQVGQAMAAYWNGDRKANPAAVAASFLVHPNDTEWHRPKVKFWAYKNPASIVRGQSATAVGAQLDTAAREASKVKEEVGGAATRVKEETTRVKEGAADAVKRGKEEAARLKEESADATARVKEEAARVKEEAADATARVKDEVIRVKEEAADAARRVKEEAVGAATRAKESATTAATRVNDQATRTVTNIRDYFQRNADYITGELTRRMYGER
jgi:type VI secretion system secreted protein VgrG